MIRCADQAFASPDQTFGLELRTTFSFSQDSCILRTSGSMARLPTFYLRPACEPILHRFWESLRAWSLTDALCDDMASCLAGVPNPRRRSASQSIPGPDGLRTVFINPDEAGGWFDVLESLESADLDAFSFAGAVFAATVVHHPYSDGNGRMARALLQGALASRGVLKTPSLALGPASYKHSGALITAIRTLGGEGDWTPFFRVLDHLVRDTVPVLRPAR